MWGIRGGYTVPVGRGFLGKNLGSLRVGFEQLFPFWISMHSPFLAGKVWLKIGATVGAVALAFWLGRSLPENEVAAAPSPAEFELAPGNDGATFRFTPPRPLRRLITEWEPQRATVLTMSFAASMSSPDIALFQIHLLEVAHRYNDILVFSEHDQTQAHAFFLSLIREHPRAEAILAKTHFVDSRNLMTWTRDFGPIFGLDRQNELVALDHVYRNLARDLEEAAFDDTDSFRRFITLQGDAMPADLAVEIESRYDIPVNIVRPPLMIDGGDFVHDGRGNVFISRQTLVRNGGNRPALEQLFQLYFGATKLHVLQSLPGATVNHLDMVLKFVDDQTVILPEFQANPDAELFNSYRQSLVAGVQDILASNERYLRRNFPELRIIKIPMPPIQFMPPEDILAKAIDDFIRIIALERGVISAEEIDQIDEATAHQIGAQVIAIMEKEIGPVNLDTAEGFNAVLRSYGHVPLEKLFDVHSETVTRYLSYLNSLFVRNAEGKHGFIVPRFTSPRPDINARFKRWEREVEKGYRAAWPEAAIHWINCDAFVADSGFIHCMTITVPAVPATRP
jgi:agmatine/peptidylarginine deiminase